MNINSKEMKNTTNTTSPRRRTRSQKTKNISLSKLDKIDKNKAHIEVKVSQLKYKGCSISLLRTGV
jgi:hypothetical protein